jgi:hypothetical protein
MLDGLLIILVVLFLAGIGWLLSIQQERKQQAAYKPAKTEADLQQPLEFVASEARIVPTHANYSNKFNDVIGNANSGIIGPGVREVVIPSDWYMSRTLPTEFDGHYWPRGTIDYDFIYPGGDPKRPLRNQSLYASQTMRT